MHHLTPRRRIRGLVVLVAIGRDNRAGIVVRHWLPLAAQQVTTRPELAGVGIAADVLDAVKWGA